MFCRNCGNKLSEADNFCVKCGSKTKNEILKIKDEDDSDNQIQIIDLKAFSNKCVSCSASIDENSFKVLNNKPYCIKCFNRYSYQSTSSDNEFITSDLDNNSNKSSDENIESDGCGFKILFIIGFLTVIIIIGYLYNNWNDNNKFVPQTSKAKNKSNYPDGVSSACFCMDALSGGTIYGASYEQKNQCRKMYKCWDNAQADCLLGTSRVWYDCIN